MSLSPRKANISDEIFNLRRSMRDLASISTLSASWAGYDQERIADSLADVLMSTLSLDLIYVKFTGNCAKSGTEVARCSQTRDSVENLEAIRRSIDTWLSEPFESSSVIAHPFQKGMLSVAYALFGDSGNTGTIVAGSSRPEFPLEHERLLISVGADQAAMAIRQKRMEEERLFLLERERDAHKEVERASRLRGSGNAQEGSPTGEPEPGTINRPTRSTNLLSSSGHFRSSEPFVPVIRFVRASWMYSESQAALPILKAHNNTARSVPNLCCRMNGSLFLA
jgi:hypothetical protein